MKVGAKEAGCGENGITKVAGPTRMNSLHANGACIMRVGVMDVFPSRFLSFLGKMTVTYSSLIIWQLIYYSKFRW